MKSESESRTEMFLVEWTGPISGMKEFWIAFGAVGAEKLASLWKAKVYKMEVGPEIQLSELLRRVSNHE